MASLTSTVFTLLLILRLENVALDLRGRQRLRASLRRKLQLVVDERVDVLVRLRARRRRHSRRR